MVGLNSGRILCPVHWARIGCVTHLGPCALKEWGWVLEWESALERARVLQSAVPGFAEGALATIGAVTDVSKPVGVENVATEAAPAGHWAVLEVSARRVAPLPTARSGKVLVVAEPAPAGVEFAGSFGEKTG